MDEHAIKGKQCQTNFERIQVALRTKEALLIAAEASGGNSGIELTQLNNEIAPEDARQLEPLKIMLFGNNTANHEGIRHAMMMQHVFLFMSDQQLDGTVINVLQIHL